MLIARFRFNAIETRSDWFYLDRQTCVMPPSMLYLAEMSKTTKRVPQAGSLSERSRALSNHQSSTIRIVYIMATQNEYGPKLQSIIKPLITGVGPIEAAISTSIFLSKLVADGKKPDYVISLGSAASGKPTTGTVWKISTVTWKSI